MTRTTPPMIDQSSRCFIRQQRESRRQLGPIPLKSPAEIEAMRHAGEAVHAALAAASDACLPGVTTAALDAVVSDVLASRNARPLFLNYPNRNGKPFPASSCISINEQVVHGIPGARTIEPGDLVTIDCGAKLDGWCADAAITVAAGRLEPRRRAMVDAAGTILSHAIELMHPGARWSEVASDMQSMAIQRGFGVVREYVGHGIGRELHEPPQVPCFAGREFRKRADFSLAPGMVLAVEPMLTLGSAETTELRDGWTVVTTDGSPACHVEHTIAVTRNGPCILTGETVPQDKSHNTTGAFV